MIYLINPFNQNASGFYTDSKVDNAQTIFNYMKGKSGRVMIENYLPNQPASLDFDAIIGPLGDGTQTFILRESSISDQFMVPVRNGISQSPELWGITSFKAFDKSFLKRP